MKKPAIRWMRWLGALVLAGVVVAASGIVPVAASSGHWVITELFLRFSMKRSVALHSLGAKVPDHLDRPEWVVQGAKHYEMGCRECHGSPGRTSPRLAGGMTPVPPDLSQRVGGMDPKALFYVVKNGLKFTGMPAWPSPDRDDEVWAMVAFLRRYPSLGVEDYERLVGIDREKAEATPEAQLTVRQNVLLQQCARCHGANGEGLNGSAFPQLAGQHSDYLHATLTAYAQRTRFSGTMELVVTTMTDGEYRWLARYYAAVPSRSAPFTSPEAVDPEKLRRGKIIAHQGMPPARVPACVECHHPRGRRAKPDYPLLAGQPAAYLEAQLALFKAEKRGGTSYSHLMAPIAKALSPEDAEAVALYFASETGASIQESSDRE